MLQVSNNNGHKVKVDRKLLIFDSLMVLLNLSMSYSIIPYLLFFQSKRWMCIMLITIIDVIYILCRMKLYNIRNEPLLLIYILLHFVCLLSALMSGDNVNMIFAYLLLNSVFYYFLYCMFRTYSHFCDIDKIMWYMVRGYIWLVFICLISSFTLFLLMKIGVDLHINNVSAQYDLFASGYERGKTFYMPYYLGILLSGFSERFVGFQTAGTICGIYFEPHIVTFMIFPAFFLLLYYYPKLKIYWISAFLLIVLLTGSTTNILSLLGCLIVFYLYNITSFNWKNLLLLAGLTSVFIIASTIIDWDTFYFVEDKLDDSGSMQYSQSAINFAFNPKTLLGTNFYDISWIRVGATYADVGYVNFILNIMFLGLCVYYMIKLFVVKTPLYMAFLLFGCYFMFHSSKVAMTSYSLTMLTFIMFCVSHLAKCKIKRN